MVLSRLIDQERLISLHLGHPIWFVQNTVRTSEKVPSLKSPLSLSQSISQEISMPEI